MKTVKILNAIAISLPIVLGFIGIGINDSTGNYFAYALYSTMLTGFIQVLLGIFLLYNDPKNIAIQLYIATTLLFFLTWYLEVELFHTDILVYILVPIPLLLALFLSIVIYKKASL
ncbi:hypothetical protein [Flavobacterium sp.]|uniref:hypothetical protein n=1 Tax=Flavobacterium sp. TaxID=239 RepID=UPI002489CFAB|nr:hypothetical protein [Flavobacterium sp.]MDI1318300.1 hypothetical protein [Flavobacterium sp.]